MFCMSKKKCWWVYSKITFLNHQISACVLVLKTRYQSFLTHSLIHVCSAWISAAFNYSTAGLFVTKVFVGVEWIHTVE